MPSGAPAAYAAGTMPFTDLAIDVASAETLTATVPPTAGWALPLILQGLTAIAMILLVVRVGLFLRERSATLDEVHRLHVQNQVLVMRLRRELEERDRVQADLVDASRMSAVGELAATFAHDLNNPLTGVLGYTELLLAGAADAETRADLEVIRSEALRVRDRIRALMESASPGRTEAWPSDPSRISDDRAGPRRTPR